MPTIVFASPKGGCGKSTSAVILATEAAYIGIEVTLIDCDPNRSVSRWAEKGKLPKNVNLVTDAGERNIVKEIDKNDKDGGLVIVDLEGIASLIMTRAVSRADLVVIPMKPTQLDAEIGIEAVNLIREQEETFQRSIAHAVVLTMTKYIRSKSHRAISEGLRDAGLTVLETELLERAAFSSIFSTGGDLRTMGEYGNMGKAQENAAFFTKNILDLLETTAG